jgi:hypothetical protein
MKVTAKKSIRNLVVYLKTLTFAAPVDEALLV